MRIAIFSDIHGNAIALDAVLADIEQQGAADTYIVNGDHAGGGFDPSGSLERLAALAERADVRFVRGNADVALITGWPGSSLLGHQENEASSTRELGIAYAYAWTHGHLVGRDPGWLDWLRALPLDQRITLPDGSRLLAVHAAPGHDGSEGDEARWAITPDLTDDELREMLAGCDADLVCVGHTHWPLDRTLDGVRVVNHGSVSNPWSGDLRASYVFIDVDESGYRVEYRRVAYDLEAVIEAFRRSGNSGAAVLIPHFRGEVVALWSGA